MSDEDQLSRRSAARHCDEVVVKLEGVTKTYQRDSLAVNALAGVDLEIRKGDFAVLVGPSGSGKTTLLNLIGGLDTPTSGRILDRRHRHRTHEQIGVVSQLRLRQIGFVFQEFNLIPVLSAIENVEFIMLLQGLPEARTARALDGVAERARARGTGASAARTSCPADSSSGSQWPARSPRSRSSFCPTSRPRISTPRRAPR